MRQRMLIVLVVLSVLVSGCAGLGGSGDTGAREDIGQQAGAGDGGGEPPAEQRVGSDDDAGDVVESVGPAAAGGDGRVVVREGNVTLRVSNLTTARRAIEDNVTARGGYVADSRFQRRGSGNTTWRTGRLVVRVPAENFSTTREAVNDRGTVEHENVRTRDVTEQLVDIEARLANLERERDRLREFLDEANDTEDLVTIEQRLSTVQGEIERLEAQRRALLDRVTYSTLTVDLREPRPEAPEPAEPTLAGVFTDSVADVVATGEWLIYTVVALTPWALAVGVPGGVAVLLLRRRLSPSLGLDRGGSGDRDESPSDGGSPDTEPSDATDDRQEPEE
jgi:hypothetical protein